MHYQFDIYANYALKISINFVNFFLAPEEILSSVELGEMISENATDTTFIAESNSITFESNGTILWINSTYMVCEPY